jgi:hypothetical protein
MAKNNQSEILITNGDLGTGNNAIVHYNISHPNGRAALSRAMRSVERTAGNGMPVWAEHFSYGDDGRVIMGHDAKAQHGQYLQDRNAHYQATGKHLTYADWSTQGLRKP